MSAFSDACTRPFSNGTEESAWMSVWCEHCAHDHGISHHDSCGDGCPILTDYMVNSREPGWWPEAWVPEPAGSFALPSRMLCGQFQPCTEGECSGDPLAETRAGIVAEVTEFWKANR